MSDWKWRVRDAYERVPFPLQILIVVVGVVAVTLVAYRLFLAVTSDAPAPVSSVPSASGAARPSASPEASDASSSAQASAQPGGQSSSQASPSASTPASTGEADVVVWAEGSTAQLDALREQYSGDLSVDVRQFDSVNSMLEQAFATDTPPDIILSTIGLADQMIRGQRARAIELDGSVAPYLPDGPMRALTGQDGSVYGVPFDYDTAVLVWDADKLGTGGPSTAAQMLSYFNERRGEYEAGLCIDEYSWGAQQLLSALGGGAWPVNDGRPYLGTSLLATPELTGNLGALMFSGGKPNGFLAFAQEGEPLCWERLAAGKVPFALTGSWRLPDLYGKGVNVGLNTMPGKTAGTRGQPWVGNGVAYVTATDKKRVENATKLVNEWFGSSIGQAAMSASSGRPPVRTDGMSGLDPNTLKVSAIAASGTPMIPGPLSYDAGVGGIWYVLVDKAFERMLAGEYPQDVLPAAAEAAAKNFNGWLGTPEGAAYR